MKVLVIYELVPEETRVYLLDITDQEYLKIKPAHNAFINTTNLTEEQEHAHTDLDNILHESTPLDQKSMEPWFTGTLGTQVDRVIFTGFIL